MHIEKTFRLDEERRQDLWQKLIRAIEKYLHDVTQEAVAPDPNVTAIRQLLQKFTFETPLSPDEVLEQVLTGLWHHQLHISHPAHFGLYNPAPTTMGIAGDLLTAAFNPQLAAWSHSPFAIEVEQHLVRMLAQRLRFDPASIGGIFTSGGAEANHTAMLTALTHHFPHFAQHGLRSLEKQPVLYVSAQSHHSFLKAARLCGLGTEAVREIPTDASLKLDVDILIAQIGRDRLAGFAPFMIGATVGTTTAGVIDPLARIADVATRENLWFHVDGAWGGALGFFQEFRQQVVGIEHADSVIVDAHKWLAVPMGGGLYLTRHRDILQRTFDTSATYMARAHDDRMDPAAHSMQWSRRFIGLKLFMTLAVSGWDGYRQLIAHQMSLGNDLRQKLRDDGWQIVNDTPLPVVCFVDATRTTGSSPAFISGVAQTVAEAGKAWLTTTGIGGHAPVLRAGIINFLTEARDVDVLVAELHQARDAVYAQLASQ